MELGRGEQWAGDRDRDGPLTQRRRGGGGGGSARGITSIQQIKTITSNAPQVVKALDTVDNVTLTMGWALRRNPLFRLLFIVYILVLHLWVSCLAFLGQMGLSIQQGGDGTVFGCCC